MNLALAGHLGPKPQKSSPPCRATSENAFALTRRPYISASAPCTRWIEIAPSPTADATRFTFPERMSPTAKTAGKLVSSICGDRPRGHFCGALARTGSRSRPVRMKPCRSRTTQPRSQSLRGDAPVITKTCRMSRVILSPDNRSSQVTRSRCDSPSNDTSSVSRCSSITGCFVIL